MNRDVDGESIGTTCHTLRDRFVSVCVSLTPPSCMVVAWCVLLCGNGVLLCCSILTLLAGNSIILTTESSILRHIGYCYQHKIDFLTAAVISCFTLPKHSLHHICVTTVLITFDKGGLHSFSCTCFSDIFLLSWNVITAGVKNFYSHVNFGVIKVTALSLGILSGSLP